MKTTLVLKIILIFLLIAPKNKCNTFLPFWVKIEIKKHRKYYIV